MALSIALPLSGLEAEHFYALGSRFLYEQGFRSLAGRAPISPSTGSESSGLGSFPPSIESSTPGQTPSSSRPDSPVDDQSPKKEKKGEDLRIYYQQRDILNLGANVREPSWQVRVPTMLSSDNRNFIEHRSICHRLSEYESLEDNSAKSCQECGFSELSPCLF